MEGGEARIESLAADLLADPLAFLSAEHARQRVLLGHLERLARQSAGPAQMAIARALAAWFACELPLHLTDERMSVYPRLGPDAAGALSGLLGQADRLEETRIRLRADLARISTGHRPETGFADRAEAFAAAYRRRMAEEEAVLLPAARASLGGAARAAIAREMAERRR